jgi:hypothetical protein
VARAPDPRAPTPAVARLGAERVARRQARELLADAAARLGLTDARAVAERALTAATVRYSTDGGVELEARLEGIPPDGARSAP